MELLLLSTVLLPVSMALHPTSIVLLLVRTELLLANMGLQVVLLHLVLEARRNLEAYHQASTVHPPVNTALLPASTVLLPANMAPLLAHMELRPISMEHQVDMETKMLIR